VKTDPIIVFAQERAQELRDAANFGSWQVVAELCESPQAPMFIDDASGEGGMTALMYASQQGRLDVVRVLLDHGADTNVADAGGRTALMHAAASGEASLFGPLMDQGADSTSKAHNGWTSLMFACMHGHWVVEALLERRGERRDVLELQAALGVAQAHHQTAVADLLEGMLLE
jgi:hypothetical protein